MNTVTITGGTGLIGRPLAKALVQKGYRVIVLTRKAKPSADGVVYKEWNVATGTIDATAITEADYLIHLAGANVAEGRWTEARKREIVDSRVKSGELLVKCLRELPNKVKAVISASAIGWYGPDPQVPNPRPFVETDPPAADFLGSTCVKWEASIQPVEDLGKRLVLLRTGIVLSREGGAYAEFAKPLKFGLATTLGSGQQVVSWIHVDDLVRLYIATLEDERWQGVYNAVAPRPVTNANLIREMKKQKGGLTLPVPVPAFALKLGLGEMSVEVLKSTTVSAGRVEGTGFKFTYNTVKAAVEDLGFRG